MPIIGVELVLGNTGVNVHELHAQLTGLGAAIDPAEQDATSYGRHPRWRPSALSANGMACLTGIP